MAASWKSRSKWGACVGAHSKRSLRYKLGFTCLKTSSLHEKEKREKSLNPDGFYKLPSPLFVLKYSFGTWAWGSRCSQSSDLWLDPLSVIIGLRTAHYNSWKVRSRHAVYIDTKIHDYIFDVSPTLISANNDDLVYWLQSYMRERSNQNLQFNYCLDLLYPLI